MPDLHRGDDALALRSDSGSGRLTSGAASRQAAALSRVAARAEGCDARDLGVVLDRAVHAAVARSLRQERVQQQQQQQLTKVFPKERSPGCTAATLPVSDLACLPPQGIATHDILQPRPLAEGAAWRPGVAVFEQPGAVTVSEQDLLDALQGHIPAAFWALATQQRQQQGGGGGLEGWRDVGGMHEVCSAGFSPTSPWHPPWVFRAQPSALPAGATLAHCPAPMPPSSLPLTPLPSPSHTASSPSASQAQAAFLEGDELPSPHDTLLPPLPPHLRQGQPSERPWSCPSATQPWWPAPHCGCARGCCCTARRGAGRRTSSRRRQRPWRRASA